jgi:hypothetical protein
MSDVRAAATRPLGRFVELGYVTNNLSRALEVLRSSYGIDRWMETGIASIDLGGGRAAVLRIAVAYVGRLLLEIQQPVGGEVDWYRSVLPTDGSFVTRLHHLAFAADRPERLDQVRQSLVASGHSIPYEGPFGKTSRYFFADARDTLGQYLEYIHFGPEFDGAVPQNEGDPRDGRTQRLRNMSQVSYVTNDYHRAKIVMAERFGIDRWLETGRVQVDLGNGEVGQLQVCQAYIDHIQFEIIAPEGERLNVHGACLRDHEDFVMRFHHIGFAAPTRAHLEGLRSFAATSGQAIPIQGEFGGQSAYFYVDARPTLGHYLEYLYVEPAFDALIPRL